MRSFVLSTAILAIGSSQSIVSEEPSSLIQLKAQPAALAAKGHHTGLSALDVSTVEGRAALLAEASQLAEKMRDGKIDDETAEALEGPVAMAVTVLRDDAIPAIQREQDAAARELALAANRVHNCEIEGGPARDSYREYTQGKRSEHLDCRAAEAEDFAHKEAVCGDWTEFINAMPESPCALPERSNREDVVAQLRSLARYTTTYTAPATEKMNTCHQAEADWQSQKEICAARQVEFEEGYCALRASCSAVSLCFDRKHSEFQQMVEAILAAVEARKVEYSTLIQIECLLGLITHAVESGTPVSDEQLLECTAVVDTSHLDMATPTIEPITPCDEGVTSRATCSDAFNTAEYAALAFSSEVGAACTPCAEDLVQLPPAEQD